MSKRSSSKTTTNQTVTATPTNPEWVTDSAQGLQNRINGLLDTDASTLVPGASPLQRQAFGAAGGLLGGGSTAPGGAGPVAIPSLADTMAALQTGQGSFKERAGVVPAATSGGVGSDVLQGGSGGDNLMGWRDQMGAAQDRAETLLDAPLQAAQAQAGKATSRSLLDADIDGYMNPYLDSVVKSSLTGFDETAGMNRARLAAQQARGQKFSGSGSAIERALFERGSGQDRTNIEAGLRSAGYDRATELAMRDLDREASTSGLNANLGTGVSTFNAGQTNDMGATERQAQLQATGLLGDLAQAGGAGDRADLGLLSDLGGQEREIDRQGRGAEANLLSLVAALNGSQPYGLFRGQTTNQTGTSTMKGKESGLGTAMDSIGGLLAGAGDAASGYAALAALSDKRLKTGIKPLSKDAAGRQVYEYRYRGEPPRVKRTGYMAQDLQKSDPHAVFKVGKHLAVDYGLLSEAA